jgi:hypothetical protein
MSLRLPCLFLKELASNLLIDIIVTINRDGDPDELFLDFLRFLSEHYHFFLCE